MAKNNAVRAKLIELIKREGSGLSFYPDQCEELIRSECGTGEEVELLTLGLREGIPSELLSATGTPPLTLVERHAITLQEKFGISSHDARWAVVSWGAALGVIPESAEFATGPS